MFIIMFSSSQSHYFVYRVQKATEATMDQKDHLALLVVKENREKEVQLVLRDKLEIKVLRDQ